MMLGRNLTLIFFVFCFCAGCSETTEPILPEEKIGVPVLLYPAQDTSGVMSAPTLSWQNVDNSAHYQVHISKDSNFATVVDSATVSTTSYQAASIEESIVYYWRVRALRDNNSGEWSEVRRYHTGAFPEGPGPAIGTIFVYNTMTIDGIADTMRIEIIDRHSSFKGKNNLLKYRVTNREGSTDEYLSYEPNGDLMFYDRFWSTERWYTIPVASWQNSFFLDTAQTTETHLHIDSVTTTYEGKVWGQVEDVRYDCEAATLRMWKSQRRRTDGAVEASEMLLWGYRYSPELGFFVYFARNRSTPGSPLIMVGELKRIVK